MPKIKEVDSKLAAEDVWAFGCTIYEAMALQAPWGEHVQPNGTINGIAVEATNRFAIASGQDKRLNIYNIHKKIHV